MVRVRIVEPSVSEDANEHWYVFATDGVWDVRQAETWVRPLSSRLGAGPSVEVRHPTGPAKRGPEALDILVDLARWAATSAAWDATKAVAASLARRLSGGADVPVSPLTDSEAVFRARWLVAERYEEDLDALVVTSVHIERESSAKVVLEGRGWDYTCWLEVQEELVTLAGIRRVRRR